MAWQTGVDRRSGWQRRKLILAAGGLFLLPRPLWSAQAAAGFVDELGRRVLAVLNDRSSDRETRLARLSAILDEATDLELVARLVLGRYWREASEAQRREFVNLYRRLVLKTMSERLDSYGGETYEVLGSVAVDERDSMVSTRIIRPAGEPIAVDWRVRNLGGRFVVIDIVAEGVSMVVTQRSKPPRSWVDPVWRGCLRRCAAASPSRSGGDAGCARLLAHRQGEAERRAAESSLFDPDPSAEVLHDLL